MDKLIDEILNKRWITVFFSSISLQLLNIFVGYKLTPVKISQIPHKYVHWRNIFVSMIHSFTAGIWASEWFLRNHHLQPNENDSSEIYLTCMSLGYFIYDTVDIIRTIKEKKLSTYVLLLHHTAIITMFSVAVIYVKYTTFAVLALLVEVNGTFLHSRQLLKMVETPRNSTIWRINIIVNIVTYVIFRLCLFAFMWYKRTIMIEVYSVSLPLYYTSITSLAILAIINVILFNRLLQTDVFSTTKITKKQ